MGPLTGITIIELSAIGPVPFAMTLLADMGARVIRVDRREPADLGLPREDPKYDVLGRGRQTVAVDLKTDAGRDVVRRLAAKADALVEGFRPGVLERLGLGPEVLLAINPRLVVGRMTGYGQTGPLADRAGHDINYISIAGVLGSIGRKGEAPVPPLNLIGDYGGGGMFLALGVVSAILSARSSGNGQVIDAAMVDGASYMMAMFHGLHSEGRWRDERGTNILDTGAPWYDVYETQDQQWLAVGAIEKRFYEALLKGLGLNGVGLSDQNDRTGWPQLRARFAAVIASKPRAEWERIFEGTDACVTPVLSLSEVRSHAHIQARGILSERDGVVEPAPAPRFSLTASAIGAPAKVAGSDTHAILADFDFSPDEIARLERDGAVGTAEGVKQV